MFYFQMLSFKLCNPKFGYFRLTDNSLFSSDINVENNKDKELIIPNHPFCHFFLCRLYS